MNCMHFFFSHFPFFQKSKEKHKAWACLFFFFFFQILTGQFDRQHNWRGKAFPGVIQVSWPWVRIDKVWKWNVFIVCPPLTWVAYIHVGVFFFFFFKWMFSTDWSHCMIKRGDRFLRLSLGDNTKASSRLLTNLLSYSNTHASTVSDGRLYIL